MKKEDMEKAGTEYAKAATPAFLNGDFDRNNVAQAFEDGATWLADKLCRLPLDKMIDELGEYLKTNVPASYPALRKRRKSEEKKG